MDGFIVYPTYKNIDGKTVVSLFGKLNNGQSFVSTHDFSPYLFVKTSEIKKIKKLLTKFTLEKTNLTTFNGEAVSKISAKDQTDLNKLDKAIHKIVDSYEADVKPHYKFMMDHDLLGKISIDSDSFESSEKIDRIYHNSEISSPKSDFIPKLKVASIDIETDTNGSLICIGIHSENYKKNFAITSEKLKDSISCPSESDCLEKFKSALLDLDPDIITGWNVIDFDLSYLKKRFEENKIPFDIGRGNSAPRIRIQSNFFRTSTADVSGRIVLDALSLVRDPFIKEAPTIKYAKFDSYTLESVSQAILNEGKLIKGKERHDEIAKLWKSDPQKIIDYNLKDCKLVYDILGKTKLVDLAVERSQLTGLPIDRQTASIAAFDSLYIREARKRSLVSPSSVYKAKEERIAGGYVKPATPGIYHSVLVLDFKSLYPSIIKTFNIDPSSHLEKPNKKEKTIESPNKTYFRNNSGVLPEIIEKLHKAREKAKSENRELSSYAIKIIMNSFFGVLASPNSRYFNLDMANAITHFGQFLIKLTAKEIEKKYKHPVIYSDTDSIFVHTDLSKKDSMSLGKEVEDYINDFYKKYVTKNYNRDSLLELEFEKLYLSMMIPQLRGSSDSKEGAKKRYAGLKLSKKDGKEKEEIEIVGLEAIRGDWTEAAQEFQIKLLDKVFHKKEITSFIRSYIKDLKSGSMDKKLVYKKSIRKTLKDYTKTTPPHVKAARKLPSLEGNIIKYYITTDGPEPIQQLKHKLDYEHYIEKQIKPIAQQILTLFNKDFDDLISGSKQQKLF